MKKFFLFILLLLLAGASLSSLETGDPAPPFANMNLDGKFILSKNYIGTNWLIVDFFATYCVPCKSEVPELESIVKEYQDFGLTGLIMATDKAGGNVVKPYFSQMPTTLTVLIDRYMVTAKRFGVKSIPTVFLVNKDGTIVFKAEGYSKESIEKIHSILKEAFKVQDE